MPVVISKDPQSTNLLNIKFSSATWQAESARTKHFLQNKKTFPTPITQRENSFLKDVALKMFLSLILRATINQLDLGDCGPCG
jgi:hypothetical protein